MIDISSYLCIMDFTLSFMCCSETFNTMMGKEAEEFFPKSETDDGNYQVIAVDSTLGPEAALIAQLNARPKDAKVTWINGVQQINCPHCDSLMSDCMVAQ